MVSTITKFMRSASSLHTERQLTCYATVLHHLLNGESMLAYERSFEFLTFMNAPSIPSTGWSARTGWRIAEALNKAILAQQAALLAQCSFVGISCDESTTDTGDCRMSVHVYYCDKKTWARKAVLAGLPHIEGAPNAANLADLVLGTVLAFLRWSRYQLAAALVIFAADGASVLQGSQTGVIQRTRERAGPSALPMHCHSHRADLAAAAIERFQLLQQLFELLRIAYNFFHQSQPRRALLQQARRDLGVDSAAVKLMPKQDVLTRWISHTQPAQVLWELLPALMLFTQSTAEESVAFSSLDTMLRDVQLILCLAALLPLLVQLKTLIKTLQHADIYILVRPCAM